MAAVSVLWNAAPAHATDQITQNAVGTYEYHDDAGSRTWIAIPCEDGSAECINVTDFATNDNEHEHPRWSANAYWTVGSWVLTIPELPNALYCKDGSTHTLPFHYSWNAATNAGWGSIFDPGICTGNPQNLTGSFTLTKVGPASTS